MYNNYENTTLEIKREAAKIYLSYDALQIYKQPSNTKTKFHQKNNLNFAIKNLFLVKNNHLIYTS